MTAPLHSACDSRVAHSWEHKLGQTGWGNQELQNYTSSARNSRYDGQRLVLRAVADLTQLDAANKYSSARLVHKQTLGTRGSLRFRVTAPVAGGVWPAIWLLPREPFSWPADGEIDLLEVANGSTVNTSCLHWGHYNAEDHFKHKVIKTSVPGVASEQGETYSLAWTGGRAVWYIRGIPVMKAEMPSGTRPLSDYNLVANIAMGGTLCNHQTPKNGAYEMIIHDLVMTSQVPPTFEQDFAVAPDGNS